MRRRRENTRKREETRGSRADRFFPYFVVLGIVAIVAIVTIVFQSSDGVEGAAIGQETVGGYVKQCLDKEPANDRFVVGKVLLGPTEYLDHCRDGWIYQYKCNGNMAEFTPPYKCQKGCQNGACLK